MEEIWKQIDDGYGQYQISTFGRVRSLKRKNEKILSLDKDRNGYMNVKLSKDGVIQKFKVHRLVALAFIANPDNLPEINHKDGNKANNCINNLEWTTRSQNMKHAYDTGLKVVSEESGGVSYGENNGRHKLTQQDVDEIRALYIPNDPKYGGRALARKYGISKTTIQAILHNQTWKNN